MIGERGHAEGDDGRLNEPTCDAPHDHEPGNRQRTTLGRDANKEYQDNRMRE